NMSRGIVESASRSLAIRVHPTALPALLSKLGQARPAKSATYLVKEQALLVEYNRPFAVEKALAHLKVQQPFLNYPVLSDPNSWSGNVKVSDTADSNIISSIMKLRNKLKLDVIPDFNWPAFRSELLAEKSLSSQMLTYYNRRLLNKQQVVLRTVLAIGINSLVQSLSAGVALKIVGSLRTGTSFEKSDCDMNLWFYDDCCSHLCRGDFNPNAAPVPDRLTQCLESFSNLRIVPLRNHHPIGYSSPTFPNRVFLANLGLLLRDVDPAVTDLQCHTGAKVPVIRAKHKFLGFNFDVSLSTRFNHKLNYLVSSLSSSCPPFTPLLIVVKGICKESRLRMIHADDYSGQLTTFKLTALLIYFLQGCGYVPPLSRLLKLVSDPAQLHAFSYLPATESQRIRDAFSRNARNLETLLKQFLRFLINYDFSEKALDLLNFTELSRSQLPLELRSDFMVVLNPTADWPTNVTRNIRADDWKQHCEAFARVLEHLESQTDRDSEQWGLVGLFDFPETDLGDPVCDRLQQAIDGGRRVGSARSP
ncbi:hypothetical protein BOX15_Mlig002423g1, partial [Macrostomum lignano]